MAEYNELDNPSDNTVNLLSHFDVALVAVWNSFVAFISIFSNYFSWASVTRKIT